MTDLLIVNPSAAHGIYGSELAKSLIAVEPPLWCRLIAGYVRDRGHSVKIIDGEAENLEPREIAARVLHDVPRLICIAVYGHQPSASTQQMYGARRAAQMIKNFAPNVPIIMVGGHVAALPERTLDEEPIDFACNGEGPVTVEEILAGLKPFSEVAGLVWRDGDTKIRNNPPAPLLDVKDLHGNAWDLLPMKLYRAHNWQCFGNLGSRQPYASIYTSLGCPYRCLAGDTLVNTIYGDIPIRELAEKYGDKGVPVYTYDATTKKAMIVDAINIRKYGESERLARVHFDDGTHIDCTPDHKFLQFSWRGDNVLREFECEAKDLQEGAHVRAIRFERHPVGYVFAIWARKLAKTRHRLVMEYMLGRERYRKAALKREASRTAEERRASALKREAKLTGWRWWTAPNGDTYRAIYKRHPDDIGGRAGFDPHRGGMGNHRVLKVEMLWEPGDVYCLTVPKTGWFYANNVLVKNCSFCCIQSPFSPEVNGNRYRMRAPEDVVTEVKMLHEKYGVSTIKIIDELFVLNRKHYGSICQGIIDAGLGDKLNIWAYARVDTVHPENLDLLRRAGVRWLALGIESGSKHVRDGADKALRNEDIIGVVRAIQATGINVIGNYIFGLPDDDAGSMRATLDLAQQCNTEFANFYCAQAYPGSKLYDDAVRTGAVLPSSWRGYSQHNADSRPLDTEHVSGATVLKFRDEAFLQYFQSAEYLAMIEEKFGRETLDHVKAMTTYRLPRKLLEA